MIQDGASDHQMTDNVLGTEKPRNSPKHSKDKWERVKQRFLSNDYVSLKELADEFGIHSHTLTSRMVREKWNDQIRALQSKIELKIEEKAVQQVDIASNYLLSAFKRSQKYERMLDASADNLGAKLQDGTPLVDPDMLDVLTRSEARIHELAKSALRIAPISQVDITSKGESLGSSFAAAMERLRAGPALTEEQVAKVLEDREVRDKLQE